MEDSVRMVKAVNMGSLELVRYLIESGEETVKDEFFWAAYHGHLNIVQYFHENGYSNKYIRRSFLLNKEEKKTLVSASRNGHFDVVQYLYSEIEYLREQCDEALSWAAFYGHFDIVKYLYDNGADIHTNNDAALRWSSRNGFLEVVKYLIDKGANIHAENNNAIKMAAQFLLYKPYYSDDDLKVLIELGVKGADTSKIENETIRKKVEYDVKYKKIMNDCIQQIHYHPLLERTQTENITFLQLNSYLKPTNSN